eukprot:188662_1
MSSNQRKRAFACPNENNPPHKKRKLSHDSTVTKQLKSSLFSHISDLNQFNKIYIGLYNCEIITQLHIPTSILQEISELATGHIFKCDNYENCQNEILLLNEYKILDSDDREFYYNNPEENEQKLQIEYDKYGCLPFNYEEDSNTKVQIFCKDCKSHLRYCSFRLDETQTYGGPDFYCSRTFICDNNIKKLNEKLDFCVCGKTITQLCEEHRICRYCKYPSCWPTFEHRWVNQCHSHIGEICCGSCNKEGTFCENAEKDKKILLCGSCGDGICDECVIAACWCAEGVVHEGCVYRNGEPTLTLCECDMEECNEWVCIDCGFPGGLLNCICWKCGDNYPILDDHLIDESKIDLLVCEKCEDICGHFGCDNCIKDVENVENVKKYKCMECGALCNH